MTCYDDAHWEWSIELFQMLMHKTCGQVLGTGNIEREAGAGEEEKGMGSGTGRSFHNGAGAIDGLVEELGVDWGA